MAVQMTPEKVYEACLVELYKTMRAASFYAHDHPALAQSAERSLRYFQNLLRIYERLEFSVSKTQIAFEDKPLQGQAQVLSALAGELFRRRMKKIIFLRGIELQDMLGFLRATKIEPDELARLGGMEKMLAKLGVRAIFANEVDFSKLEEIEEEEEPPEEEFTFNLTPEQKALRELLQKLLSSDDAEFVRLLKEVMDRASDLAAQAQHAEIGVVLDYLFRYVADNTKSLMARELAEKAIRALATREVLQVKIDELAKASEDERQRLTLLFQYIGKATIPFLLTALSLAEDRTARRNLSRAIIAFGEKAVPRAIELLRDERWYVQRNMLVILAEIGKPEHATEVLPFVEHPDPRVGKEAVKAAVRLGGDTGLAALVQRMAEVPPAIQAQVALLIGGRRWLAGREVLEHYARRGANDEIRVAACEALGKLAQPESLPVLVKLYRNKGWFKRAQKLPVRRAALKALVNYGGQAQPYLRQALSESDSEMQALARLALERLGEAPSEPSHEV